MGTVGIPVKLLHEAVGHTITIELKGGVTYRGRLFDAEDNFNISMKDIAVTARDGKQTHLDSVYIRGNMVRFMVVPDMLQQAPMFKRVGPSAMKGRGIGSALLSRLIEKCEQGPWRQMLAIIGDGHSNAGSIAIHKKFGFSVAGQLRSVGYKMGDWRDTLIMQRPLGDGDWTLPE